MDLPERLGGKMARLALGFAIAAAIAVGTMVVLFARNNSPTISQDQNKDAMVVSDTAASKEPDGVDLWISSQTRPNVVWIISRRQLAPGEKVGIDVVQKARNGSFQVTALRNDVSHLAIGTVSDYSPDIIRRLCFALREGDANALAVIQHDQNKLPVLLTRSELSRYIAGATLESVLQDAFSPQADHVDMSSSVELRVCLIDAGEIPQDIRTAYEEARASFDEIDLAQPP